MPDNSDTHVKSKVKRVEELCYIRVKVLVNLMHIVKSREITK